MKKLFITIFLVVFFYAAKAQWTTSGNDIYNSNTGNVGIGAAATTAKLNVFQSNLLGSSQQNYSLLSTISGRAGNNFMNNIWLVRDAAGIDWTTARLHDGVSIDVSYLTPEVNTKTWWERDPYNNIQSWGTFTTTYLTINQGKVGIGTTNPQNLLDVAGTVHSKQVNVDLTGWPDYVFKPHYQLPTLSDVKAYIDQNQHLPGIPSEKEMVSKGLDVGEMNKALMQKVEELTLYLIDKDKEVHELKKSNQNQQQELNALKTQLAELTNLIKAKITQ